MLNINQILSGHEDPNALNEIISGMEGVKAEIRSHLDGENAKDNLHNYLECQQVIMQCKNLINNLH